MTEQTPKKVQKVPHTWEKIFYAGYKPEPSIYAGGIERFIACLEEMRRVNTGGWGSGTLKRIPSMRIGSTTPKAPEACTISCSPMTASVIGMLFDPGPDGKGANPRSETFAPVWDNGKQPMTELFYGFHNTSLGDSQAKDHPREGWREARAWLHEKGFKPAAGFSSNYGAVGSCALWNLGYEIDIRDARRGDLVHISWDDAKHGGHAVFCWDVHLDETGAVDCFEIAGAHGNYASLGVSVASISPAFFATDEYKGTFKPKPEGKAYPRRIWTIKPKFLPYFVDRPEFVSQGAWKLLPLTGKLDAAARTKRRQEIAKEIRQAKSFKVAAPLGIGSGGAIDHCEVLRFWGYPPPDRSTERGKQAWNEKFAVNFLQAQKLARYPLPAPYCMGEGKPYVPTVGAAQAVTLPAEKAKKPEDVAKLPAKPTVQKIEHATPDQFAVEESLATLFQAGYIECGPGDTSLVHDDDSVKALKAFQRKVGLKDDGIPGKNTRKALFQAVAGLAKGKTVVTIPTPKPTPVTAPAAAQPPAPPASAPKSTVHLTPLVAPMPKLEDFSILQNHAPPGGDVPFVVEGRHLDVLHLGVATVTLTECNTGKQLSMVVPLPLTVGDRGRGVLRLPQELQEASLWNLKLELGAEAHGHDAVACKMQLRVDRRPAIDTLPSGGGTWSWDENKWPKRMRDIVYELRNTAKPTDKPVETWCFSTYGVKEKLDQMGPRDKHTKKLRFPDGGTMVPVLGPNGEEFGKITRYSLYAADIEGTIMLKGRVLNISSTGRPNGGSPPHRYENFDASKSRWHDVTDRHPWGSGSIGIPLVPYRVLAINRKLNKHLYRQIVYIKALDGVILPVTGERHNGMCLVGDCGSMDLKQFDFFKGRQDVTFRIKSGLPNFTNSKDVTLPQSEVVFVGPSHVVLPPESRPPKTRKKKGT